MNSKHKTRILILLLFLFGSGIVIMLVLYALQQNINLFFTPQELIQAQLSDKVKVRVGGMVRTGSLRQNKELRCEFVITDFKQELTVNYIGVLPDLFREGQGVVALGHFKNNIFEAEQILAKHDETYMPPNIKEKLAENVS